MDIYIIRDNLTEHLCTALAEHVVDGFASIYEDAKRLHPSDVSVLEQTRRFLLEIQSWSDKTISSETRRILGFIPSLRKILKCINYINIRSIALMKRHVLKEVDDAYVSKNTPGVKQFVHQVYVQSSREFFHDTSLLDFTLQGTRLRQNRVVRETIRKALTACIPLQDLLMKIPDDDDFSLQNTYRSEDNGREREQENDHEREPEKTEEKQEVDDKTVEGTGTEEEEKGSIADIVASFDLLYDEETSLFDTTTKPVQESLPIKRKTKKNERLGNSETKKTDDEV